MSAAPDPDRMRTALRAFHAAMIDAGLDTTNRLIAPGLLTACKDARPLESALDAIAEAREFDACTTREEIYA